MSVEVKRMERSEKMQKIKEKLFSIEGIFVLVMCLGIIILLVSMAMSDGDSLRNIIFVNPSDTYMDFFNSVFETTVHDPYRERFVIYPAFTYLLYSFFEKAASPNLSWAEGIIFAHSQIGKMLILGYIMFCTLALLFSLKKLGGTFIYPLVLLFSAPFIFAVERGNSLMLAVIGITLFLTFYQSTNPFLREIAYISLAAAASIKITPAVFGILLIKKKDWIGTEKCIFWGIVLFLAPFLHYKGAYSIVKMLKNILTNSNGDSESLGYGLKLNLSNTLEALAYYTGLEVFKKASHHSGIICLAMLFPYMILGKAEWKIVLCSALACILATNFSYMYNTLFILPAVILFLKSERATWDNIYLFLFLAVLVPLPFDLLKIVPGLRMPTILPEWNFYQISAENVVSSFALIGMACCLFAEGLDASIEIFVRNRLIMET